MNIGQYGGGVDWELEFIVQLLAYSLFSLETKQYNSKQLLIMVKECKILNKQKLGI